MAEGYCWVCDRPVDEDPCPTCGTRQYHSHGSAHADRAADEVLDTTPGLGQMVRARSPLLIGLVVLFSLIVLVLVFQGGAGIS